MLIREAPAMKVRQNLGELLNEVQYRHDSVLITKGGKPVAALIDVDLFNKVKLLNDKFQQLTSQLRAAYQDASEAEIDKDINEALRAVRKKRK